MNAAALILSILAILIALGSLWFTWLADRRPERAERRGRRASIVVESRGGSGVVDALLPHTFAFTLRNLGASPARRVQLWLTDRDGRKVSTHLNAGELVIAPDDPPAVGSVDLLETVETAELEVWIEYTDEDGTRTERSEARPT